METIGRNRLTLKQIFHDNWDTFRSAYKHLVTLFVAYNVWKIMHCREPERLGYATYACPDHNLKKCALFQDPGGHCKILETA
jgi:hypothetical protein